MRENRLDTITDKLRLRVDRLLGTAHKQFRGSNPYRQEIKTPEQRISDYMQWAGTPVEQELRQELGDVAVDGIHMNIQRLIDKGAGNG